MQIRGTILLVLALIAFPLIAGASPLSIDWGKTHLHAPEIKSFRHARGSVENQFIFYYGNLHGIDAEIQLSFIGGIISDAVVIIGSDGLNSENCLEVYKTFNEVLNKKYGKPILTKITSDPMANDLLYSSICNSIQIGLYETEATWVYKNYKISSLLWGDQREIFIEISYYNTPIWGLKTKLQNSKLLQSL